MRILHTMLRVGDLDRSIDFYTSVLGMQLLRRKDYPGGKFTLAFVGYDTEDKAAVLELTYNWEPEEYTNGRNFGHLAYEVENIYEYCAKLQQTGVVINRPPRDGKMAFIKSPDGISIELLQAGEPLSPEEPWKSMPNTGEW